MYITSQGPRMGPLAGNLQGKNGTSPKTVGRSAFVYERRGVLRMVATPPKKKDQGVNL